MKKKMKQSMCKRIAWWLWRNEWIPLGFLAPYVLGVALGSMPKRVKTND